VLHDAVRGEVRFPEGMVGDFVLLRSNGLPTYNFACVVDDSGMAISHVIRAEEHLPNTARQLMLYAALAWFAPNTQTIMGYDHKNRTVGQGLSAWQKRPAFLYATAAVLAFGVLGIQQHSEFIYFRF